MKDTVRIPRLSELAGSETAQIPVATKTSGKDTVRLQRRAVSQPHTTGATTADDPQQQRPHVETSPQ